MTRRQRQLQSFIKTYKAATGDIPTQFEMAQHLKTSQGSVAWLLSKLEDHGAIQRGRGWRNIKLLEAA